MDRTVMDKAPKAWLCESSDGANCDAVVSVHARDVYARMGRTITPLYTKDKKSIDWDAAPSGEQCDPMNACNGE